MPVISNKKQMYRLLTQGQLGNTFRVWDGVDAFKRSMLFRSCYSGLFSVRCKTVGAPGDHHLGFREAVEFARCLERYDLVPIIQESSPDSHITLQGEFMWWNDVFYLSYSTQKAYMRTAMLDAKNVSGREAEVLLRHAMGQESWSDFVWLSMIYPEHAFEFTAYDRRVGVENKYVICWEVRAY